MMEPLPRPSQQAAEQALVEARDLVLRQQAASAPGARRTIVNKVDLGKRMQDCSVHGVFEETGIRLGEKSPKEIWSGCPECKVARAAAEQEANDALDRQRAQERRDAAIDAAGIPKRFRLCDFDGFVADTPDKQSALALARDYAEQIAVNDEDGLGLLFLGLPGTGKTFLACAILNSTMSGRRRVQYITCQELIQEVRATWQKGAEKNERQVLAKFCRDIDLLVVDEVGVQAGTDAEKTTLFQVIDKRYAEMRPTVLLTNLTTKGFQSFVGDRAYDRLKQVCRPVVFDWASYRTTARDTRLRREV